MTQTPPRILPLPREEWTDEAREVFAFWGEPNSWEEGSKTNIIMVMANHPPLATAFNIFGKHLLLGSTLPVRPRELVVLRMSWHLKADYEWHYHVGYALNIDMTLDEIEAIKTGPDAGNWNEQDKAVLQAVDELWENSRIEDATWATLSKHFDRKQLMDLVFTAGNYVMISWGIAAFGIQLEDGIDKVGFDLKTESGKIPGTRFRPGEVEDWTEQNKPE